MVLALNTQMWHDRPLDEALQVAASTGITALDLAATLGSLHADPRTVDAAALRTQLSTFPPGKLQPGMPAGEPTLISVVALAAEHPDLPRMEEEGGEEAVEYTISAIRLARTLGARVVSTSLGSTDVDAWDAAWSRATSALRMILGRTSSTGVRLAVKLDVGDVLNSQKKLRRLLDELPDRRLGITLDTAILHYLRIPISAFLEIVEDRLFHVHLRDATRSDFHRAIGQGEVNFPATFRALEKHGYRGALSLNLYGVPTVSAEARDELVIEGARQLQEWLPCSG